jgi:uncharacterized coiled-coil protein SlyX
VPARKKSSTPQVEEQQAQADPTAFNHPPLPHDTAPAPSNVVLGDAQQLVEVYTRDLTRMFGGIADLAQKHAEQAGKLSEYGGKLADLEQQMLTKQDMADLTDRLNDLQQRLAVLEAGARTSA